MSEFKGTPGDWEIELQSDAWFCNSNHRYRIVSRDKPTRYVASVEGDGASAAADATLIIAARDMLKALIGIRTCIRETRGADATRALAAVDAAISKALTVPGETT